MIKNLYKLKYTLSLKTLSLKINITHPCENPQTHQYPNNEI